MSYRVDATACPWDMSGTETELKCFTCSKCHMARYFGQPVRLRLGVPTEQRASGGRSTLFHAYLVQAGLLVFLS